MGSPSLYMHLEKAILTPTLTPRPFLPFDALEELITADSVKAELTTRWYQKLFPVRPSEIVENAKKLFAVLTLIGTSDKIWELLAEGMRDEHLPLSRHLEDTFNNVLLSTNGNKSFQSFEKWNDARVNDFLTKQWVVQAPVLDVTGKHYTLNDDCAIPIAKSEELEDSLYSIVHRGEVHPAHQSGFMTENGNLRVAIKEFRTKGGVDLNRQKENLEKINSIHHQHLIRYYATYQWSNRYCVIFPWADGGNLSEFWKQNDKRDKTTHFTTWFLRQIHGLAAALETLHSKNCRHGDLKPDNILYFNQLEDNLVIADVGHSRFYRSGGDAQFYKEAIMFRNEDANTQAIPSSYQGPEVFSAPDAPRPRRYDIWSLGCILLEFLVWYLHNFEAVEAFRESRITGNSSYFYMYLADGSFEIHPKVVDKISALQADTRCQENAFGDLLALIKDHMLQIEVQERHNADQISMKLHEILHMAESDPTYLMNISGLVEAVSDGLPSLKTGQTAESVEKKPELMSNKESNDNDSEMSEVRGVSTEDQDKITTGFTEEITKRIQDLLLKFSSSPLPQKRFQHVFAKKLRQFAHNLVKDIPRTVEARRKRNAAKLISKRRNEIAAQSIRMLFPTEETDIKAPLDIGIQDVEPTTHDRIHLMDRPVVDDESWLSDACEDEMPEDLESEHTEKQYQANTLDYIAISRYLTSSKEFSLLDSELESLAKHYCSDVMGLIQRNVLERLGSDTKKGSTILFQVTWNLRKFVHEQFQTTLQDIGHILTITGDCCDAYLTTIDVYFEQTWPSHSRILLRELQKAVLGNIDNELPVIHSDSSNYSVNNVEVSFADGVVLAKVSGSHNFIYTIGQQLAWLGAVCRDQEDGLVYCDTICSIQDQTSDNELGSLFTFEYSTSQFDEDEPKPCWHRLIGNMTVATGFPVPDRPDEEQGLQIPIEIMASLGHVLVLDDFGSGIILKGDVFDFLPISRKGNNVQWHLVDSAQNALQEYESTEGSSRLSQDKLPPEELSITTVFLGWTQHITNHSGTEAIDYAKIEWARLSQTSETSVKLTSFSFNLSYIFGSTATFTVGQKQYAREVRNLDNYDEIIRDLQDRSVVLYDTLTQRGWLLDAKRATLQILLHRYQTRKDSKCIDFGPFHQPLNIHSVMNENRGTKLWEDWDSIKNVKKDVYFATEVKNIREKLVGLSFQAQAEYQRLNTRKNVIGFEYRDLVETPENLQALETDLHSSCGEWPKVAHRQLSATVLFGKNFQEIFTPKENAGLCSHCQRMPGDKSYLAVETETIRELLQKKALSLVSNDSIFSKCGHLNNDEYDCAFVRAQAIRVGTTMNDKVQQDIDSHAGAIIIGELTPRQTSVSKGTGQKSSKRVSGKDTVRRFWRTQISLGQSSLKKSVS